MTVTEEITVLELRERAWSGAQGTLKYLHDDEIEQILSILDDNSCEPMSLTCLNDFFWFETNTIAEWLGFYSFEDIMKRENQN